MKEIKIIGKQEQQQEQPKVIQKEYELVQVPTQHSLAVQTPEGEVITTEYAIVEILNKLNKMEKAMFG